MKRFVLSFFVFLISLPIFSQGKDATKKLLIDPFSAVGGSSAQLLDSVEFIPLETSKASLFGSIWKMEVLDDYFVIGDQDTRSILVFDRAGKFYSRIDKSLLKDDPGLNFTVDRERKLIITRLMREPQMLYWIDLKGTIVKRLSFNEILYSAGTMADSLVVISPWNYTEKSVKKDSGTYAIQYLQHDKIMNRELPIPVKPFRVHMTTSLPRPNFFYSSGDPDRLVFVGDNYDYTVRILGKAGIERTYILVFPQELALPTDFMTNDIYRDKEDMYIKDNLKKIVALRNVFLTGGHLCFETVNSTFFNKDRFLYYNLATANMVSLERITSDSSSFFLPLLSQQIGGGIVGCNGKSLYSAVTSLEVFQAQEANKGRDPRYTPALQNFFKTSDKQGNPVLIRLKFKENI